MTEAPALADPNRLRFSPVAIALHWTIAALIVTNIVLAWRFDALKEGLAWFRLIQLHKSIGVTVLLLSVLRLLWRLVHPPPAYPAQMRRWEKAAASAVHWGFYGIMLGLPLTGWAMVSASPTNLPTLLFRKVRWPHIGFIHALPLAERKPLTETLAFTHEQLANLAYALIVLHVAAALRHQFFTRDRVLWRMLPLPAFRPRDLGPQEDR
jgi:cytochrome b561